MLSGKTLAEINKGIGKDLPLTLRITNCEKIQFWKKLFTIGFPHKHCNF